MNEPIGFPAPFDECGEMQRTRKTIEKRAKSNLPLVIAGENGTGRTTMAEAVAAVRAARGRGTFTTFVIESSVPSRYRRAVVCSMSDRHRWSATGRRQLTKSLSGDWRTDGA